MSFQKRINRIIVWPPFDERGDAAALSAFQRDLRYYVSNLDVSIEYYLQTPESANRLKPLIMPSLSEHSIISDLCDTSVALKRFRMARYGVLWRTAGKPSPQSLRINQYVIAETPECRGAVEWLRLVKDIYLYRTALPKRTVPFPKYPVRSCAVLGTGPSVDLFETEAGQFDAWIGSNAVAIDPKIRRIGNPFALCALDPYLFSPYTSSQFWRTGLISLLRETRAVFITARDYSAFVELNFPDDVKPKCHYVQTLGHDTTNLRTKFDLTDLQITPYGNVLTDLMLPVATTISQTITLFGCDGMPPRVSGNFPKAKRYIQIEQMMANEHGDLLPEAALRVQIDRMSLSTRYVVDECLRHGVQIQIRRPSWNAGLAHLPVLDGRGHCS